MMTACEICRFLEEFAPLSLAEPWDNVGLLLGRTSREVQCVMTCLTLTPSVAREAICQEVQFIVTHHPILFRGTKKISDATAEGRLLLDLAESGIVVYSPHTAFDSAASGINQWLAESIGLQDIQALRTTEPGGIAGTGRYGEFPIPMGKLAFLSNVRDVVGGSYLEFSWNGPDEVRRVAIACGSGAEYLDDAVRAECDAFVTGEARFHSVLDSQAHSISLVLTGHFFSERPAIVWLATLLQDRFPGLRVFASAEDRNPLELHTRES